MTFARFAACNRFAKISGGKKMIGQVAAAEKQNVDVAGELAMLKTIVE